MKPYQQSVSHRRDAGLFSNRKPAVTQTFKTLMMTAALSLCATGAWAETLKIGAQPWLGYGPLWVAAEKGFFKEAGVDVEIVNFNWDQDLTAGLASGNLHLVAAATNTTLVNINQSIPVVGILVMDEATTADAIIAAGEIKSIADLKGKSVAYERGATSDLLLNYALKNNGMSLADITPVPMGASEAGLALIAGSVEAAVTYEPYISAALREGEGFETIYTAAEKPGLISDILVGNPEWVAANGDEVKAVIRAWDMAVAFVRENPAEGGALIAAAVGAPMEEFEPAFKGVHLFDSKDNARILEGQYQDTVKAIGEIMIETNPEDITRIVPAEDLMASVAVLAVAAE